MFLIAAKPRTLIHYELYVMIQTLKFDENLENWRNSNGRRTLIQNNWLDGGVALMRMNPNARASANSFRTRQLYLFDFPSWVRGRQPAHVRGGEPSAFRACVPSRVGTCSTPWSGRDPPGSS